MWKIPRTNVPAAHNSPPNARALVVHPSAANRHYLAAGICDDVSWTAMADGVISWWRTDSPNMEHTVNGSSNISALVGMLHGGGFVFVYKDVGRVSVIDMKGDTIPGFEVVFSLRPGERVTSATVVGSMLYAGTSSGSIFAVSYPPEEEGAPTLSLFYDGAAGERKSWLGGFFRTGRAESQTLGNGPIRLLQCPKGLDIVLAVSGQSHLAVFQKGAIQSTFMAEDAILAVAWGHCGESSIDAAHLLCGRGADRGYIIAVHRGEVISRSLLADEVPALSFHALVILDNEYHVFSSGAHIIKQCETADVKNANTTDCVIPMNVIAAGGGDKERSLWYFTPLEMFCVRRAQKSVRGTSSSALLTRSVTTLSSEARERFMARFESVRYDSIDAVCTQISKEIVDDLRVHHGNWNRANLAVEDGQLVAHIHGQLESRSISWDELYLYLTTANIWSTLHMTTQSTLLRHKETLCILRSLRELQNSVSLSDVISTVAKQVLSESPRVEYASHSEIFYSTEVTPQYMLRALAKIGTPETIASVLDTVVTAIKGCRDILPASQWTTQREAFLDPVAQLLHILSDAIASLDAAADGSPADWQSPGTDLDTSARKDAMTNSLCDTLDFYLRQVGSEMGSQLLVRLFLRDPFVRMPIGYPHGPLQIPRSTAFRTQWLDRARQLAISHSAFGALLVMISSSPLKAPRDIAERSLIRLAEAIENYPGFVEHLCMAWQKEGRGFELISLAETLAEPAATLFRKHCAEPGVLAPNLRWLLEGQENERPLFDVALQATSTIQERSAYLCLAKLAARAEGRPVPSDIDANLHIARTQQKFFPAIETPQTLAELIRLLTGSDCDGLVAAAGLVEYVPEIARRATLLEALLRSACEADRTNHIIRALERGSEATDAQQREAVASSVVLRMAKVSRVVKEWVQSEATTLPKQLVDVREALAVLRAAQRAL